MNDLSPEARRTLAQAKSGQPRASQALRTRVKANVLRAVAAEPVDMPLQAAGNSSALSKSAFSKLPAWALPTLGAFAVIGGIATFAARPTAVDQSPAMPRQEAPASQLETAALERRAPDDGELEPMVAAPEAQEPQLSPRTKARAPAVSQARRAEPARDGDLRAEMQLLARAEAALRANEPLSALSILDARERGSGQLQVERDGLRLIAQCALGRDPRNALARYLSEHRDGVLQGRIRASCARFLP